MTTPYLSPPVFSWPAAPGGKLHTYQAGGTVAQATYSDAAGVTPNTNPVTLDSLGSAVVRLAVGVAYHFTLKDATDTTTLWDADNFDNSYLSSGTITAAIVGAVLYPRTNAEIAAAVTPSNLAYPAGDVRRYGALVDGATNDTAAVALGVLQMQNNGAAVYFPGGTCVCQINIAGVATGYVFRGEGMQESTLKAISPTADVFTFTAGAQVWGLTIEKLSIIAAASSTDGSGIHVPTGLGFPPYNCTFRDLRLNGFGRSCIYDQAGIFTSRLENAQGNNTINHNFDLLGGNTLELIGCYAHGPTPTPVTFTAGVAAAAISATLSSNWLYATDTYYVTFSSGERRGIALTNGGTTATWSVGLTYAASATAKLCSAGYRVRSGNPTFINCNGIDQGNVWGIFSNNAAEDGGTAYCSPVFIDSNVESFTELGIRNKQGGATFIRTPILGHAQDVIGTLFEPLNASLRGSLDADALYTNTAAAITVTFTGAPSGTSATLASNWAFSSGVWPVTFSDAEVRSVTLTNGATTATWSGALTGSPTSNATTVNWRFGYGAHTASTGGAPYTAVFSPSPNSQFSYYAQSSAAVATQSTITSSTSVAANRIATTIYDLASGGITKTTQHAQTRVTITYSASMTPDASAGCIQEITATDGVGFTINAPTNPLSGQTLTLRLKNTSGGALGAITLNAAYHTAAAFPSPANTKNQSVTFYYDGAIWAETARTSADVAN